jgi:hypothetical protein
MFEHDKALIQNKYDVTYYICPHCEFIQTEKQYWLEEAYSKVISSMDTSIMSRNLYNADTLLLFIYYMDNKNIENKYLDFSGGHGVFTRIMRDNGFDFYWYDKFAENIFENGFEGDINDRYQMITSFENFEHFAEPIFEIEWLIKITDILYFSTAALP